MSDFHTAWANESMKAARAGRLAREMATAVDARPGEPTKQLGDRLGQYLAEHWDGTLIEPHDVIVGQGMSRDRRDSNETSADTNPCKPNCP